MPNQLPSFGVVLTITNPISQGYLAFLAAIRAWNKIADRIVIIDGGSDDGTLEIIRQKHSKDIEIVSNEITHWGKNDGWHALQLGVSLNHGLEMLDTDWAFAFSTDYIPYSWDRDILNEYFIRYADEYWIRSYVGKPRQGKIKHRINNRNILINLKKAKKDSLRICYGLNYEQNPSDFPIIAEERAFFVDPVNGFKKYVYRGPAVKSDACIDLECIAYGHFFYSLEQLEYKLRRWNKAYSKYYGIPPASSFELKINQHFDSLNWGNFFSKEEVLSWDHPQEIVALIEEYYDENMIGGVKPLKPKGHHQLLIRWLRYKRKLVNVMNTRVLNNNAGRDMLVWESLK